MIGSADAANTLVLVGILLRDASGRYLLQERKDTGWGDGLLGVPGGHIEPGETLAEAAIREAAEELGVTVRESALALWRVVHRPNTRHNIDIVFVCDSWQGVPTVLEPRLASRVVWLESTAATDPGVPLIPYVRDLLTAPTTLVESGD